MYVIRKNVVRESKLRKSTQVGPDDSDGGHTIHISPESKNRFFQSSPLGSINKHPGQLDTRIVTNNNTYKNNAIITTKNVLSTKKDIRVLSPKKVRRTNPLSSPSMKYRAKSPKVSPED